MALPAPRTPLQWNLLYLHLQKFYQSYKLSKPFKLIVLTFLYKKEGVRDKSITPVPLVVYQSSFRGRNSSYYGNTYRHAVSLKLLENSSSNRPIYTSIDSPTRVSFGIFTGSSSYKIPIKKHYCNCYGNHQS